MRYYSTATWNKQTEQTLENTMENDDDQILPEQDHRHYDRFSEDLPAGTKLSSTVQGVDAYQRRGQGRLAVSRLPWIEPIGHSRDAYYQSRLMLGLPWHLKGSPKRLENDQLEWEFFWDPPHGAAAEGIDVQYRKMVYNRDNCTTSFEQLAHQIEDAIYAQPGLVCPCCGGETPLKCKACLHATSFHHCAHESHRGLLRWAKGTLYGGTADYTRILWVLHQKGVPTPILKQKADDYVAKNYLKLEEADSLLQIIEKERGRGEGMFVNDGIGDPAGAGGSTGQLSAAEMQEKLDERVAMMRDGGKPDQIMDQARVYDFIAERLADPNGAPLRLIVQASAGTGKSFLLTSIYLLCLLKKLHVKATAPTGIASANIDIPGTAVSAETLHHLLSMDGDLQTKLDVSRRDDPKVMELNGLKVLLIDEFSMVDTETYNSIVGIFRELRRGDRERSTADGWGKMHVIFFGDLKQLPPATTHAPFIRLPEVRASYDFRVLNQNRRVVQDTSRNDEIENFHRVLMDVAVGRTTERVKQFFVEAYMRGVDAGPPEKHELEGSTSIWTKRRFRDRYNRIMVKRIAKISNHTLKIRGRVRARGARGENWYSKRREQWCRSKARTNALWTLQLAGDFCDKHETERPKSKPHLMRVMLTSNMDVKARFANGTQGRLLCWHPNKIQQRGKSLPSSWHDLYARFCKESSYKDKTEIFPDIDFLDITPRPEPLNSIRDKPLLLQLGVVPSYALIVGWL